MKVKSFFFLLLILMLKFSYSHDNLTGFWHGAVNRLGSIQIVEFNFFDEGNTVTGNYSIPDMGLYEEPVDELNFNYPNMRFKTFMGYFDVSIDSISGEITGTNTKWDPPLTIHLKKMLSPQSLYNKEYISFPGNGNKISGNLFKPVGKNTFPVVILIHGADEPQSRRNWRYRYFAYLLSGNGYGTMIFDKRGIDSSTGNKDADFFELAEDVKAGVEYLSSRNDVEKDKIGILGASRGGWVAEIYAANYHDIAFAILFLGPSQSVWEQQLDAVEYQMKQENFEQVVIDSAVQNNKLYFQTVNDKKKWDSFQKSVIALKDKEWKQYLQLTETYNDSDMIWWRKNNYNPEKDLKNVKCPVLSIFGANDPLVPPEKNIEKMQQYLFQSGQKFEIKIITGLPHNIHYNQTLRGGEWKWPSGYWVWPKKSIELERTIIEWLNKICGE